MRWPLIYQVTLPLAVWTLLTVTALSALNYGYARSEARQEVSARLGSITTQLAEGRFPLAQPVLRQIEGLTGTELAVMSSNGELLRATVDVAFDEVPRLRQEGNVDLSRVVSLSGDEYFHVTTISRYAVDEPLTVHLLYPKAQYNQRVAQAFWPLMLLGLAAVAPMVLVASYLASRITRPIAVLRRQVGQIAEGDFVRIPAGRTRDELSDLAHAINQMSQQLEAYSAKVRTMERAQVLGQIGAGFSHQIRNAMTGGQMALGLHQLECNVPNDESLQVAQRQMKMVEHIVQSMLRMGSRKKLEHQPIVVRELIENTVTMVAPQAAHHALPIAQAIDLPEGYLISGDFVLLQTCLMNLLLNGIEATLATQASRISEKTTQPSVRGLEITATPHALGDSITIQVCDEGRGPDATIAAQLFEPLVTSKQEGTGLGLAVVREIVELHGGTIQWYRVDERTCFEMNLHRAESR